MKGSKIESTELLSQKEVIKKVKQYNEESLHSMGQYGKFSNLTKLE